MGLFIRDDGVKELARRLADRRGCTMTEAVRGAIEAELGRDEALIQEKIRKTREICDRMKTYPELRPGFTDKDLYDDDGSPIY